MTQPYSPPYFIIPISYNSNDEGPETDPSKIAYTRYEIWDASFSTVSVHETMTEAQDALIELNKPLRP